MQAQHCVFLFGFYMSQSQAAQQLNVLLSTLRKMLKRGELLTEEGNILCYIL